MKDKVFSNKNTLSIHGKVLDISSPKVMGIINVTPDSFFSGSRKQKIPDIIKKASTMLEEGATFLDIGGYSTRPGATEISIQEEVHRVVPAIDAIMDKFPEAIISIDTFRSEVAGRAIEAGAALINDVSGGNLDPEMKHLVVERNVPFVIMHMKGTPATMNTLAKYENLLIELMDFFQNKVSELHSLGVKDIIVDPGFGFSKTVEQNYVLLRNLTYFEALELPILVGISRKSMISKTLGIVPEEALNGTTVLNTIALQQGAGILRVHDVREAFEAVTLYNKTFN